MGVINLVATLAIHQNLKCGLVWPLKVYAKRQLIRQKKWFTYCYHKFLVLTKAWNKECSKRTLWPDWGWDPFQKLQQFTFVVTWVSCQKRTTLYIFCAFCPLAFYNNFLFKPFAGFEHFQHFHMFYILDNLSWCANIAVQGGHWKLMMMMIWSWYGDSDGDDDDDG